MLKHINQIPTSSIPHIKTTLNNSIKIKDLTKT